MRNDFAFWSVDQKDVSLFCCCFSSDGHFVQLWKRAIMGYILFIWTNGSENAVLSCDSIFLL